MPSERVDGMVQNWWTASIGIAGRHGPDYALSVVEITGKSTTYNDYCYAVGRLAVWQ
jgi:hypothetical protein